MSAKGKKVTYHPFPNKSIKVHMEFVEGELYIVVFSMLDCESYQGMKLLTLMMYFTGPNTPIKESLNQFTIMTTGHLHQYNIGNNKNKNIDKQFTSEYSELFTKLSENKVKTTDWASWEENNQQELNDYISLITEELEDNPSYKKTLYEAIPRKAEKGLQEDPPEHISNEMLSYAIREMAFYYCCGDKKINIVYINPKPMIFKVADTIAQKHHLPIPKWNHLRLGKYPDSGLDDDKKLYVLERYASQKNTLGPFFQKQLKELTDKIIASKDENLLQQLQNALTDSETSSDLGLPGKLVKFIKNNLEQNKENSILGECLSQLIDKAADFSKFQREQADEKWRKLKALRLTTKEKNKLEDTTSTDGDSYNEELDEVDHLININLSNRDSEYNECSTFTNLSTKSKSLYLGEKNLMVC